MSGMYPDEQKISIYGKETSWPGLKDGKFTNGDFNNPLVPPSMIPADTLNLILDNLNNLVTSMGGTPDNAMLNQLVALFTVAATAHKGIKRDASGRAKVAAPEAADDIARKAEVDAEANARTNTDNTLQGNINAEATARANADKNLQNQINTKAPLNNAALTGIPTAPTAGAGTNNTQLANTAFVRVEINRIAYPIGAWIVRYPEMLHPAQLYGGTWTKVETDGYFPRFTGGNAVSFSTAQIAATGGLATLQQGDGIRNITGSFGSWPNGQAAADQALFTISNGNGRDKGSGYMEYSYTIKLDVSRVVPTAPENRPYNKTCVLYKKTAL